MMFSTHRNAGQFVGSGRGRLLSIVRWLGAVLALQLAIGFATAQESNLQQQPGASIQQTPVQKESRDLLKDEIEASQEIEEKGGNSSMEAGFPETQKMRDAREEFNLFTFKNLRDALEWQAFSTKVIFGVVIVLVLAGLYLSWMQFNLAHKVPLTKATQTKKGHANKDTSDQSEGSTIEVSTSGVKITSTVVGLVILTLSIVFFFLYMEFVYPLKVLPATGSEPLAAKKEAKE